MAISVTVLGSGSAGNSTLIASSRTRILVDAGFSCRETFRRLRMQGVDPETIDAIIISHEHSDHVSGVWQLAKKVPLTVYMTHGTHVAWRRWMRDKIERPVNLERFETFEAGKSLAIGDFEIQPFTTPHDAADPVGFTFRCEGLKIGVASDFGHFTPNMKYYLQQCDGLVIESNHDLEMLRTGPYPFYLKQRIASKNGHLSNEALAEFLAKDYDGGAAFLVLAHLSEKNNHPEIARSTAERALTGRSSLFQNDLLLAMQNEPLAPLTL